MARSYVLAIPVTVIDSATMDANYDAINPNGLDHACFLIRIVNDSNITITVSLDGDFDNDIILPNETLQLALQTNSSPNGYQALIRKGTVIYVSSASGAAGVGNIYLIGYYQEI